MWPERLLHVSQTIRVIADDIVRGELFRLAQMRTPRTYSELSVYDAQFKGVMRSLMESAVDQLGVAESLATPLDTEVRDAIKITIRDLEALLTRFGPSGSDDFPSTLEDLMDANEIFNALPVFDFVVISRVSDLGYAASRLDKVKTAHFMVGGIPEKPVPPIGYTITWSADGLIDEYVRDVNIIEGGKKVSVPALSGLEEIEFPGVGVLESFYTDGLRTLADSIEGVDSMWEKTLRYPGHVEKVKLLRELGFFADEPVKTRVGEVTPKDVTARIFERTLWMPEVGDLLAMMINVSGELGGEEKKYVYRLVDYFNHETGVSAMARTTSYTAAIVAGMLAKGMVTEKGVLVTENLAKDPGFTEGLLTELRKRGVKVEEVE